MTIKNLIFVYLKNIFFINECNRDPDPDMVNLYPDPDMVNLYPDPDQVNLYPESFQKAITPQMKLFRSYGKFVLLFLIS